MAASKRRRLTAEDWTDAALDAISEEGLAALAVEPLAARMGTTKGSFYWHFDRRESLLDAVLARWEAEGTEAVIAAVGAVPDVGDRLRRLFELTSRETRAIRVEHALIAEGRDPRIAPVLARVTTRRIEATTRLFSDLGHPPDEARRRGLMAYTHFLGYWQLRRLARHEVPDGGAQDLMDTLLRALTWPAADAPPAPAGSAHARTMGA